MKTIMKLFACAFIFLPLIFASSSKDGEIGPAGIQGTNGGDGLDDTFSSDGTDGEGGYANVQVIEHESETISTGSVSYTMQGVNYAIATLFKGSAP